MRQTSTCPMLRPCEDGRVLPDSHPLVDGRTATSPLVRALRGDRPERLPVWFMRQAGRSLPEYRALRGDGAMLEACLTPGAGAGDHPAAGAAARGRRGDPLQRHRRAGAARGRRCRDRSRARTGDRRIRSARASDVLALRPIDPDALAPISRGGRPDGGRARVDTADRIRRRAVHARLVPGRGRPVEGSAARPLAHVRGSAYLGDAAELVRGCDRRVPAGAGRGGGERRPALRLVDGIAVPRRLAAPGRPALATRARRAPRAAGAAHPLRSRQRGDARPAARHRRGRGRDRLAHAAG